MSTKVSIAYGQVHEGPEDWASFHWWDESGWADNPKFPITLEFTLDTKRISVDGCTVRLQVSKEYAEEILAAVRADRWKPL